MKFIISYVEVFYFTETNFKIPRSLTELMGLFLSYITAQKMKFFIKDFFSKCSQIRGKLRIWPPVTEEVLNGKLHFLCSIYCFNKNTLFYKQLGSGLGIQSCVNFQGFAGSKLLNDCLLV